MRLGGANARPKLNQDNFSRPAGGQLSSFMPSVRPREASTSLISFSDLRPRFGVGTQVADGKDVKTFDGQDYILERGIFADLAIVKAWKADATGNLVFRKTARNFNQPAATCGKVCVVEVEEIVPVGSLDPDCIHLPGVYVQRIIVGAPYDKKIEFRTVREREAA